MSALLVLVILASLVYLVICIVLIVFKATRAKAKRHAVFAMFVLVLSFFSRANLDRENDGAKEVAVNAAVTAAPPSQTEETSEPANPSKVAEVQSYVADVTVTVTRYGDSAFN